MLFFLTSAFMSTLLHLLITNAIKWIPWNKTKSNWMNGVYEKSQYIYFNPFIFSHLNNLFSQLKPIKLWIHCRPLWVRRIAALIRWLPTCPFRGRNSPTVSPKVCGRLRCRKRTWRYHWTQTKNFNSLITYSSPPSKKTANSPAIPSIGLWKISRRNLELRRISQKSHTI